MLKLKLQYFGHLMQRTDSLEKIMMLGKTEGKKKRKIKRKEGRREAGRRRKETLDPAFPSGYCP